MNQPALAPARRRLGAAFAIVLTVAAGNGNK